MAKNKRGGSTPPPPAANISDADMKKILSMAEKFYEDGKLEEANNVYRQILAHDSHHAESLYMMGMIARKLKNFDAAEKLIHMAIVEKSPDDYIYYNGLGDVYRDMGKQNVAVSSYKKSISLNPDYTKALNNMGTAFFMEGKMDDAFEYYQRTLLIDPENSLALFNVGLIYESRGNITEAHNHFLKAIAAKPDFANAYNSVGNILKNSGQPDKAAHYFQKAIEHKNDYKDAYINMGTVLKTLERHEESIKYFLKAISLKPQAQIHAKIAEIYHILNQEEASIKHYEAAIALDPNYVEALNNIGSLYFNAGLFEKSAAFYERVLEINPDYPSALNNYAGMLKNFGELEKAMDYYKRAIEFAPKNDAAYSNMLLAMIYTASVSPEELAESSREFGRRFADPLLRTRELIRDKSPDRKLRIGYVSPDFKNHAVNYFFENLLDQHNRNDFEIYAYSNTKKEDFVTDRLKKKFDYWRDISGMNDDKAADKIESDLIDILVDIAGHTGGNRLLVFARKPAPIQVTWLGYPATTGIKAIDYRISDYYTEPKGMTEHLNTETLWRLPQIFCCYGANERSPKVIDHPPFEDNGYITFGCFNNFSKVTDPVLETWRKILGQVPDSRLMLEIAGADGSKFKAQLNERFKRLGISEDRIIVIPRHPSNQFVLYNKIDLALDPFPCAGGTTSMDTMWMGVPLITLAGHHFVSRMGVTILNNVGLSELVCENTDEYISKAAALGNERNRLRSMRHNLREKVMASPMMDQVAFAKNMEAAYRQMWQKYCAPE